MVLLCPIERHWSLSSYLYPIAPFNSYSLSLAGTTPWRQGLVEVLGHLRKWVYKEQVERVQIKLVDHCPLHQALKFTKCALILTSYLASFLTRLIFHAKYEQMQTKNSIFSHACCLLSDIFLWVLVVLV